MIKIYSTPSCTYCKKAEEFFKENNVMFEEVNVVSSKEALDNFVKKTGQRAVPVFDIDGELILGYDKDVLKQKIGMIG